MGIKTPLGPPFPIPSQPDDLIHEGPFPCMEFELIGSEEIALGESIRFSVSWTDMPIEAAIELGLQRLPVPENPHQFKYRNFLPVRIGRVIRMTQASGRYDVEWALQHPTRQGAYCLVARFVPGRWVYSPFRGDPAAMPPRTAPEQFIGPAVQIKAPPPRPTRPTKSTSSAPADLPSLAEALSSLSVVDAMAVMRDLQSRWDMEPPKRNRQPWPMAREVWPTPCGMGRSSEPDVYPLIIRDDETEGPGWDVALYRSDRWDDFGIAEVLKRLWGCGTTEAMNGAKNTPLVIAAGVRTDVADDIVSMFQGLGAELRVLRTR